MLGATFYISLSEFYTPQYMDYMKLIMQTYTNNISVFLDLAILVTVSGSQYVLLGNGVSRCLLCVIQCHSVICGIKVTNTPISCLDTMH